MGFVKYVMCLKMDAGVSRFQTAWGGKKSMYLISYCKNAVAF